MSLFRERLIAHDAAQHEQGRWPADEHQGQGLYRRHLRASDAHGRRTSRWRSSTPRCAKGALEDAGLTKDDVDGYFCAGDAPGLGPLSMADYMGLKLAPRGLDRDRRLVLRPPCRPRRRGDRGGQVQGGADHAGRPAARRGHGDRHRAAQPRRHADARRAVRVPLRADRREHVRHVRHAPHARVRHDRPSSSPGSRSRPRTTRSTTSMRCCARWSRSRRW